MKENIFQKIYNHISKEMVVSVLFLIIAIFFYAKGDQLLGQTFASGNFDLEIDNECSYNGFPCPAVSGVDTSWTQTDLGPTHKFFFFDNVKPGDFGSDSVSFHLIDSDGWGRLVIGNIVDSDNSCVEPETSVESGCNPSGDGELRENMGFWAWLDQGQTAGFQGKSDPGEGDNIQNYGEMTLISKGPIDALGETWDLADGLSAAYANFGCSSATLPVCNGLNSDGHISKDLSYYFGIGWELPIGTGDEVQSDTFGADMTFQASEFDFDKTVVTLENKDGSWNAIEDDRYAELAYDEEGPTFDWVLKVFDMPAGTYRLVYAPDPWPQGIPPSYNIKTEIATITIDSSGSYNGSGSKELNLDLPDSRDSNYKINYAKVWIVPAAIHNTYKMTGWNQNNTLFDMQSVNYHDTDLAVQKTINLADLGADPQYGYVHDYSGANVSFTYNTPANGKLSGTITATGLKPYATYQLKFDGIPTCQDSVNGNNAANEYIGYKGRWWDNTTNSNTNDAGYLAFKDTHCINGYLVWDFITANASGNVTKAVATANSYHVLFSGGGVCNSINNDYLAYLDPAHPTIKFSPADKVNGQIERFTCGGLTLDAGSYDLQMTLTEESFHQGPGTWTAVMSGKINFGIY